MVDESRAMSGVPLCRDCKHARRNWIHWPGVRQWRYALCTQLIIRQPTVDIVSGEIEPVEYAYCVSSRGIGQECGPDGKLFEPRTAAARRPGA
jgi:hypothetical protein